MGYLCEWRVFCALKITLNTFKHFSNSTYLLTLYSDGVSHIIHSDTISMESCIICILIGLLDKHSINILISFSVPEDCFYLSKQC